MIVTAIKSQKLLTVSKLSNQGERAVSFVKIWLKVDQFESVVWNQSPFSIMGIRGLYTYVDKLYKEKNIEHKVVNILDEIRNHHE